MHADGPGPVRGSSLVASVRWFLSVRVPKLKYSAIGEHDPVDGPDELAVLDRSYRDGDLVAWLKHELIPSGTEDGGRRLSLANPMLHLTVITLYVELQQTMRIGPEPFRYRPLHIDCFPLD